MTTKNIAREFEAWASQFTGPAPWLAVSEITYKTLEGCVRCTTDIYVPHYNCMRPGQSGHSASHCTANACY